MSQTHYSAFTVQSGQVPSTQTNFPVLLNPTDTRFRYVSNGGHAANTNSGKDLRPYSDSGLTTPLTYELVTYTESTGTFEMWVNVPSLADGSVIYVGYGDTTLTIDGSSTSTWDTDFTGVWHLQAPTASPVHDSSQSARHGTNSGSTATTGQIGGAAAFVTGSSQSITLPNADLVGNLTAYTLSFWFKTSNTSDAGNFYGEGNSTTANPLVRININDAGAGRLDFFHRGNSGTADQIQSASNYADNAWHYVVALRTAAGAFQLLVDNSSVGTGSTDPGTTDNDKANLGVLERTTLIHYLTGSLDEVRRSKIARSANWNTTSYNNQSAPGTFYSIGTEVATGGGGAILDTIDGSIARGFVRGIMRGGR